MSSGLDRLLTRLAAATHRLVLLDVLLTFSALAVPAPVPARGISTLLPPQSELVRELASPAWTLRAKAVTALGFSSPTKWGPEVRGQLVKTFAAEQSRLQDKLEGRVPAASYPEIGHEPFAEYYSALCGLVLELHDRKALPLLVKYANSTDPRFDTALATYGKEVLNLAIDRLQTLSMAASTRSHAPDFYAQAAMADILTQLARLDQEHKLNPPLTHANYKRIRLALRPLLASPNSYARLYACMGLIKARDLRDRDAIRTALSHLLAAPIPGERTMMLDKIAAGVNDKGFVPMRKIRELAQADPYRYSRATQNGKMVDVYPVRERAARLLDKFAKLQK